jgi:hypothetical protein
MLVCKEDKYGVQALGSKGIIDTIEENENRSIGSRLKKFTTITMNQSEFPDEKLEQNKTHIIMLAATEFIP